MRTAIEGCGTALVTPFLEDMSVDFATFETLVERQVEKGIHFLVPCGTTGESVTLSTEEQLQVVRTTKDVSAGRVPVVAGVGGNNTAEVLRRLRDVEAIGVDAILSVTPYYNKPSQEGLLAHYKAIAGATALPIIVYSVAGRTGVNIEPETILRLAEVPNIAGVKEASGNIAQIAKICATAPPDFAVYAGDDAVTIPVIALGGRGIISVASNEIPAEMAELAQLALKGDFGGARALLAKFHPLMEVNFIDSNPVPVKTAMAWMNLLKPVWRLPLVPTESRKMTRIREVLETAGLL
ncbi:MAG: 4-hydroxy-tetrahydrodipicolinate synthase [Bryobacterales bacterium]|nr:4-hydroxy-tetrahydrodipicolinate synthase [Bryobacterales bacterium]